MKKYSKTKVMEADSMPAIGSWIILVLFVGVLAYQFIRPDNGLDSTNGMLMVYLPRVIFFSALFIGFAILTGKMFHHEWWEKSKGYKTRKKKSSKK